MEYYKKHVFKSPHFLKNGGEMGELIRSFAWSQTSVGAPELWPESLQITLNLILNSAFPMMLWWGDDLIQFYNDAFRTSLGANGKHPEALGQRTKDSWPETWPTVKPLIDKVMTGSSVFLEDQLIPIKRNGKLEDVYWTFSYSPVYNKNERVSGILVTCHETTEKVLYSHTLSETNEELSFAIEAAELATWDFDPIANTFTANERYREWFGLDATKKYIDNNLALKVIAEEDRERVINTYKKCLDYDSGCEFDIEYTIRPEGLPERILRAKGKTWFNEEGVAWRFNGTLQDITDMVRVRRSSEEREKNLRNTILKAPVAMCIFKGADYVVEIANEKVLEFWGLGDEAIGKPIFDSLPQAREEGFEDLLNKVFTTGETVKAYALPVTLPRPGGLETVYVDFIYEPFREVDGSISGVMAVAVEVTEQVTARKKIEKSAREVQSVIESSPHPIAFYTGKEMRIRFANQSILNIWGKGNDVIGKLYSEVLPELDNQEVFDQLDKVYTTGEPFHARNQALELVVNGTPGIYYFNYSFTPLRDADGNIYGVLNTGADVTDLNVAKKKIEESELLARSIIQKSSVAQIIWTGEDMVCTMVNESMLDLVGRDTSIIGEPYNKAFPELQNTPLPQRLKHVYQTGETWHSPEEKLILYRFGIPHEGYYNYTYQALKNTSGENYAIICTAIEVTDQVHARKKLEEEKERTKLAMDAGELGVFEIDLISGNFIHDNRFNEILGSKKPLTLDQYKDVFQPEESFFENAVLAGTGTFDQETKIILADNTSRWIRCKGKIYKDQPGIPARVTGVIQDITERKEAEKSLEDKNAQLTRINNDLDNFIYTASHDLKAPMSNIEGLLNSLKDTLREKEALQDEETAMLVQLMDASVNRFKNTILDLTEITKAQKEETEDINELALDTLIEELKFSIIDKIEESGAEITTDFSEIGHVRFSRKNLRSIIYNLLSNAIKYRHPERNARIRIRTKQVGNYTILSVQDNGMGIPEKGLVKLFTMFKRFHDHVEGTGIGLYIVKRIMENSGGKIEVESEEGKGSTFRVYFKSN